MMLFLHNADNGHNAANDELVAALRQRIRAATRHHDQPPPGSPREDRRVIFIADFTPDPGRPSVELPPEITAPGGRSVPPVE